MADSQDLAGLPDVKLGDLNVSPSLRRLAGPLGETTVQPRTMQVFVCLHGALGSVVSRESIFQYCWPGAPVGDDNLNRAIVKLRRAIETVAPGVVAIDTVPRTGYRLRLERAPEDGSEVQSGTQPSAGQRLDRRFVLGGIAGFGAVGIASVIYTGGKKEREQVRVLIDRADRILRYGYTTQISNAEPLLRQALEIEPDNARALGLLSYAHRDMAEMAPPSRVTEEVRQSEDNARRALAIDPKEPNARVALATLRPEFGHWAEVEDDLRAILSDHPRSFFALNYLAMLLQAVGRSREAYRTRALTMAMEPNSPMVLFRRSLVCWIVGQIGEADLAVDRGLQSYPLHTGLWNARLFLFVFTRRFEAARAFLDDRNARPASITGDADRFWRPQLRAIETGASSDKAAARDAILDLATRSPAWPTQAIMSLSYLGELDATYAVTDGFLLRRGPLVGSLWEAPSGPKINDQFWRRTMNLFTPACRAMRLDPRWDDLCRGIGLTDYWSKKGIGPDEFLMA